MGFDSLSFKRRQPQEPQKAQQGGYGSGGACAQVREDDGRRTAIADGHLKGTPQKGETLEDILPDAFAALREASGRVLGMKHFHVQIVGGICLFQGRVAEMKTV